MTKVLQAKIKKLTNENKNLHKTLNNLRQELNTLTSLYHDVKSNYYHSKSKLDNIEQSHADVRLRAQKAELALEALTQANIDSQIATNMKKHKMLEEVKALLESFK